MESLRLPRFTRAPEVSPIRLADRDQEIIRLVHRHRFLRSSQIVALIGDSAQPLLRRLQLLYHHGYLERPRAQIDYYERGGSRPIVYGVSNKGATLLKVPDGPASKPVSGQTNRGIGRIFLDHALLVSEVMVKIELACRKSGNIRLLTSDELSLRSQFPNGQHLKWRVNVNSHLKLGVIPDRVFALEYTNREGKPDRAFFFLEADRGTMPVIRKNLSQTSFYRKLLAYQATRSHSIHQTRFGFNRFRVLTVTNSKERLKSLVNACSQLKSGHGLFLFLDCASLENSTDLFSVLWQTGRPGQTTTLLN
jgi:DNA-binding Lrp family transcriptional regulator